MNKLNQKYESLLQPSLALISDMSKINGDILILGAGGKMGPSLAKLAKLACQKLGIDKRIIAVSRYSDPNIIEELHIAGVETISADLLNENELQALPEVSNILYLAGTKFGTLGNESFTWAMNSYLPGRVAEKFKNSNIVVFSTGNVYPLTLVVNGGASESTPTEPLGEYAQSCLGRERIFEYSSKRYNTPILIYRLNYANDVSYGVLLELAKSVIAEKPIDLSMGNVNVIWQGDANEIAIRALLHCSSPIKVVNVTGPELLSVRWIAEQFGQMAGKSPVFENEANATALLSNATECTDLFGYPRTGPKEMMRLIYEWIVEGGLTIDKKTHFQERKGKY